MQGFAKLSDRLQLKDGPQLDAFSRLRVSQPFCLFEAQHVYGLSPCQFGYYNTSDGTAPAFNGTTKMVDLVVAIGAVGGTSIAQSLNRFPYQPGKSQLAICTFVLGSGVASAKKRIGIFDGTDGLYLEQDGTNGLYVVVLKAGSATRVAQTNWNVDKFDGNGPSGITLDPTKAQILMIDFQYLAMGRVRFCFDIDGVVYCAHEFKHANSVTAPYMNCSCLPIRAEVSATTGLAGNATMNFKCAAVYSEGGFEAGMGYTFGTVSTAVTAQTSRTHAVSLRPKLLFKTVTNRSFIRLDSFEILVGSNQIFWEICIGTTFTGAPTWADVDTNYSGSEIGVGGTTPVLTVTPGLVVASGYGATSGVAGRSSVAINISDRIPICLDANGANLDMGTLTLLLTAYTGTSACRVATNFTEFR